jgi:hypothetical protein
MLSTMLGAPALEAVWTPGAPATAKVSCEVLEEDAR